MKKIATFFIAGIMILSLMACANKNPYIGTWKGVSVNYFGVQMSGEDIGEAIMEIKDKENVTVSFNGEGGDGTWQETEDGITIEIGGETITCKKVEEALEMDLDGVILVFEKQEQE